MLHTIVRICLSALQDAHLFNSDDEVDLTQHNKCYVSTSVKWGQDREEFCKEESYDNQVEFGNSHIDQSETM